METEVKKPADCGIFRKFIYAFQSGELQADDRNILQEHLDSCEECKIYLAVEDALLEELKGKLSPSPAPAGLEGRIRSALDREVREESRAWWARPWAPWLATAAAAVLLAVLLLPGNLLRDGQTGPGSGDIVRQAIREGIIVDYDCDRHDHPVHLQHLCNHPKHLNALKLDDGRYLHFSLAGEVSRQLVFDRGMRGTRVAVRGDYYPSIETFQVLEFRKGGGPL